MKKHSFLLAFLVCSTLGNAYADCAPATTPDGFITGYIGVIEYNANNYAPTFTMSGDTSHWMWIAKSYGANTDYGKEMFSLFLLAKAGDYPVKFRCSGGDVSQIHVDLAK
ncbi:Uncharacterised protein [Burkholderia pseudomallei]|nr:Uncharacterised protein [Burkholderia pseudomallei]CAJ7777515.1 Uncharacterised protein [Burkholderia pseudomallei]